VTVLAARTAGDDQGLLAIPGNKASIPRRTGSRLAVKKDFDYSSAIKGTSLAQTREARRLFLEFYC
jgi:hypothetical protein